MSYHVMYAGAPVEFLGPDTLVYQAGAGLHLRKLGGEEEVVPFLWPRTEVRRYPPSSMYCIIIHTFCLP